MCSLEIIGGLRRPWQRASVCILKKIKKLNKKSI